MMATGVAIHAAPQAILGADDLLSRPIVLVVALAIVSLLPFAFMTVSCGAYLGWRCFRRV